MQTLKQTRTTRRRVLSALLTLTLAAGLLALAPPTAFAAQTIHINTGSISGPVYGNGSNTDGTGARKESAADDLIGNTVNITGSASVSDGGVYGAYTTGNNTVSGNTVNINTSGTIIFNIHGGNSETSGQANENHVKIFDGTIKEAIIYGGFGHQGANDNTITILISLKCNNEFSNSMY